MEISALNAAASASGGTGQTTSDYSMQLPTANQWSADNQDAMAFSQALQQNSSSNPSVQESQSASSVIDAGEKSLADSMIGKMQSLSSSAEQKGQELERLIVKATDTLNPSDVIAANRMMSEYYLENLMTAKLIGNATKAIERLTSLQ